MKKAGKGEKQTLVSRFVKHLVFRALLGFDSCWCQKQFSWGPDDEKKKQVDLARGFEMEIFKSRDHLEIRLLKYTEGGAEATMKMNCFCRQRCFSFIHSWCCCYRCRLRCCFRCNYLQWYEFAESRLIRERVDGGSYLVSLTKNK